MQKLDKGGHGERGNGGLGAKPPAGSKGRAPGQGVEWGEAIMCRIYA